MQFFSEQFGGHAAGDGVLPELLSIEVAAVSAARKALQCGYTEAKILDGLEPENDDSEIDGVSVSTECQV